MITLSEKEKSILYKIHNLKDYETSNLGEVKTLQTLKIKGYLDFLPIETYQNGGTDFCGLKIKIDESHYMKD